VASIQVTDVSTATTTTVSWASGFTTYVAGQNGTAVNGVQTARPTVYQWALSIPSISGTSTYTWSTGAYTAPTGWYTTITASPSAGYTLYAATVPLTDSATATTTTINWTTSSIVTAGYAGTTGATGPTGTNGATGPTGTNGASARICYARVPSNPTPVSGNITTSGSSSFPTSSQSTTTWGFAATWSASDPNPSSTNTLYQADGIYDPSTGNTVWSTPYISSLKVGSLSAVSTNTGSLTVTGTIQANTASISGSTLSGSGAVIYSSGVFGIGNSTGNLVFDGTNFNINGTANLNVAGQAKFNGQNSSSFSIIGYGSFYYSGLGLVPTSPPVSGANNAGFLGVSTALGANVNVGVAGYAANNGVGVGGQGDVHGGYFSGNNGVTGFGTTSGVHSDGPFTTTSTAFVTNLYANYTYCSIIQATGTLFYFQNGPATGSSVATFSATSKPGTLNSTNQWLEVFINGTSYQIPIWQSN
jgi:hypothetical protein